MSKKPANVRKEVTAEQTEKMKALALEYIKSFKTTHIRIRCSWEPSVNHRREEWRTGTKEEITKFLMEEYDWGCLCEKSRDMSGKGHRLFLNGEFVRSTTVKSTSHDFWSTFGQTLIIEPVTWRD